MSPNTKIFVLAILAATVSSAISLEYFSPVKDIIKVDVTNDTATFDVHCAWSRCRITLQREEPRQLIDWTTLEPKRSYQRHTFRGLVPYTWYVIRKIVTTVDGKETVIETGRFQTKMMEPSASRIVETVCLDQGRAVLVRWSPPVPFYEKEQYRFSLKVDGPGNNSVIYPVTGNSVYHPNFIVHNLVSGNTYRISVQTFVDRFTSPFSEPQTLFCGNSTAFELFLNILMALIVASTVITAIIAAMIIWRRFRDQHRQRYVLDGELKVSSDQESTNPWSEVLL